MGLLVTFIAGLFFGIGSLIAFLIKQKNNFINFSISMSFIVLIVLCIFEILPESLELISNNKMVVIATGMFIGLALLLLLDRFIPHHHEGHDHLLHIGIITAISIAIHNIIEGICLYGVAEASTRLGLTYALGVGLHNIPFGINISLLLKEHKKQLWIYSIILILSPFLGGLLMHIFQSQLNDFFLGSMLAITMGMIIYIVFFELLVQVKENFNKYSLLGIIIGFILIVLGMVI